jgi:hypothetical protein
VLFNILTDYMVTEPDESSQHSQQPAFRPYPEPPESTPHPSANLPNIHSDDILPSTSRSSEWSLSFGLFVMFRKELLFYGGKLLTPAQTSS